MHTQPNLQPNVPTEQADAETYSCDEDGWSDINSAVEELSKNIEPQVLQDAVFSPTQMLTIQETVQTSINKVLQVYNIHEAQALLWACIVLWKKTSKTRYSVVSTLTFVCY